MADLPSFNDLWGDFTGGRIGSVLKDNPIMEELCRVIFAAAVTEVTKAGTHVSRDMVPILMLKLAVSATKVGIQSADRLLELMRKQGDGSVTVDLHGVFVPREFKV
jgi:hypothetical protein